MVEDITETGSASDITVVCADVDGTVIASDLLYESLLHVIKKHPFILLLIPVWLFKGRAYLKACLAERAVTLNVGIVPLHEEVVGYLKEQSSLGKKIILASASHVTLVAKVAQRLGFVSSIVASHDNLNCKGSRKAEAIRDHVGDVPWEYVGDSIADLKVWSHARSVVCVARSESFSHVVKQRFPGARTIKIKGVATSTLFRALRIHQWMKNVLVFVPIVLAHQWWNRDGFLSAGGAALAFSLCASGVYVLNDLLDLESDRQHPRKRKRPCASGELPIGMALLLVPILFSAGFIVAGWVSGKFTVVLALYLLLTTLYSFRLKALALVDIILLAILYTIRIVGGGVASNTECSQWLLGLSMFLFLSLACVKRFSELLVLKQRNENKTWGRGYSVGDIEQVASFGSSSGYISVLVLALYVSSQEIARLYKNPQVIWLACPLLLYWVSRIWLLARRGLVHDDPLVFAMKDSVTYVVGFLGLLIFIAAKYLIG